MLAAGLFLPACEHQTFFGDYMSWSFYTNAPQNISYDSYSGRDAQFYIEANYLGGDILVLCENCARLDPIGPDDTYTYDCGWGVFTVEGPKLWCHFPEDASPREPEEVVLVLSTKKKSGTISTNFLIKRTFGELTPDPGTEQVPDEQKFRLVRSGLSPFMNGDFTVPAPFDNITYQITDYLGRYQALGFPSFTAAYDSIVWCADGFPNTLRIYESCNAEGYSEEHFSSQWSTHFFRSGEVKSHLKGYRNGQVIYSTTLTTALYERDFLCYDWTLGSVVLLNPGNTGIYCQLDTRYEYQAGHTQMLDGTRYAHINVWNKNSVPEAEFLAVKQEALIKLMTDNIGQGISPSGKIEAFKCLPTEDIEAITYWENKTTRILLLHKLPDEDYGREDYYLHFESK